MKFLGNKEFDIPKWGNSQVVDNPQEVVPEHRHEWDLIIKTYASPRGQLNLEDFAPSNQALIERALFGVTTLLWKCVLCAETKKEEILGTDEMLLEDILNKAEKFGAQYVQKEGVTYVISKWQPTPVTTNIPVR